MNKKAEMNRIGLIMGIFIAVIVALVLFQTSADQTAGVTTTYRVDNQTVTAPTVTAKYTDLAGVQTVIGTYSITNATSGEVLLSSNMTLVQRVASDGLLGVSLYNKQPSYNSQSVNLTYTYGPDGYVEDSGARSIVAIITLLSALAIAVAVMLPSVRESMKDMMTK